MANTPKRATWGEADVFPTKHDPLDTKTLIFLCTAPPLVRVLKRKLGPKRGRGFPLPPSRGHHKRAGGEWAKDMGGGALGRH